MRASRFQERFRRLSVLALATAPHNRLGRDGLHWDYDANRTWGWVLWTGRDAHVRDADQLLRDERETGGAAHAAHERELEVKLEAAADFDSTTTSTTARRTRTGRGG